MISKRVVLIFILYFFNRCLSKPTIEHDESEGRGIGSTLWGWITYPFSWWSSGEKEIPVNEPLVALPNYGPNDIIEIGVHNVTIWCTDQTCITMKCSKSGCRNITCNIYDTDFSGECREYNIIKPEEQVPPNLTKPTENTSIDEKTSETQPTNVVVTTTTNSVTINHEEKVDDERPLQLEAMLSSTVDTVPSTK